MEKTALKPSPQLLIKLGSIIVHYQAFEKESDGFYLDKEALDSLINDKEVQEWLKRMDSMALLPKKR